MGIERTTEEYCTGNEYSISDLKGIDRKYGTDFETNIASYLCTPVGENMEDAKENIKRSVSRLSSEDYETLKDVISEYGGSKFYTKKLSLKSFIENSYNAQSQTGNDDYRPNTYQPNMSEGFQDNRETLPNYPIDFRVSGSKNVRILFDGKEKYVVVSQKYTYVGNDNWRIDLGFKHERGKYGDLKTETIYLKYFGNTLIFKRGGREVELNVGHKHEEIINRNHNRITRTFEGSKYPVNLDDLKLILKFN